MSPRAHAVDPARLARWCVEHLGSPPADEIFRSGYLSAVVGLRLADDREVVVKVRPDSPRVAACVDVQRRMFHAGYPCPQPLTGADPCGEDVATAEAYVPGGAMLPNADHAARAFAEAFAWLIRLAPRPAEVPGLDPAPSWAAWDHGEDGLWPCPEDADLNLNEVAGPQWIDDAGPCACPRRARRAGSPAGYGLVHASTSATCSAPRSQTPVSWSSFMASWLLARQSCHAARSETPHEQLPLRC